MQETQKDLVAALTAIFDQPAKVQAGKVKAVLKDQDLSPNQFVLLAQTSLHLGEYPTIMRSGTGVSVVFS